MINRDVFEDLFVLEIANNHWGDVNRGLRIIKEFGTVARYNDVRAAIKLQLRDVDTFVHKDFLGRNDIRYIKKTLDTRSEPRRHGNTCGSSTPRQLCSGSYAV